MPVTDFTKAPRRLAPSTTAISAPVTAARYGGEVARADSRGTLPAMDIELWIDPI